MPPTRISRSEPGGRLTVFVRGAAAKTAPTPSRLYRRFASGGLPNSSDPLGSSPTRRLEALRYGSFGKPALQRLPETGICQTCNPAAKQLAKPTGRGQYAGSTTSHPELMPAQVKPIPDGYHA